MIARETLTAPQIAERYDRTVTVVQQKWMKHASWPRPVGKRGRWHEFDAAAVDQVVREHFRREQPRPTGDPDDLLTVAQIAEYTGLARATVRADISRDRFPAPDPADIAADRVPRWRRRVVNEVMAERRRYRRR